MKSTERNIIDLIMETVPDAIAWKDVNSVYRGANTKFSQAAGFNSSEDIIGKTDDQLSWKEHADEYIASDKQVLESGNPALHMTECYRHKGSPDLWLDISLLPLKENNEMVGVVIVFRDITSVVKARQDLIEAKENLEQKVEERTNQLSLSKDDAIQSKDEAIKSKNVAIIAKNEALEAKDEAIDAKNEALDSKNIAIEASKAKSQFLSRMSHELRTPLNSIIGLSQLMQTEFEEAYQSPSEDIEVIQKAGKRLLHLVNNVLDLAKVETGEIYLALKSVNVKAMIEECFTLSSELAEKKHISLNFSYDAQIGSSVDGNSPAVIADRLYLKKVILNLITNAINYNAENGHVTVTCQELKQGNTIRITVEDTGRGIDRQQQNKLFIAFERIGTEVENERTEGAGIGLVLSKHLVEEMKGSIDFKSEVNIGSQFWIELPKAVSNTKGAGEKSETTLLPPQEVVKTVLYIEDDPSNLFVMGKVFKSCYPQWKLITANESQLGLSMAKDQQPDLILLDIDLPIMDGYALYEQLKQSEITCHIPVIAVTAYAMNSDIEKGKEVGFADYITKPVDIDLLTESINHSFTQH